MNQKMTRRARVLTCSCGSADFQTRTSSSQSAPTASASPPSMAAKSRCATPATVDLKFGSGRTLSVMDTTPAISRFDEFYKTTTPPWVIGEPQPAVVELERAGLIRGKGLDAGCGPGEPTILLTGLGYDVLGIDFAPEAVEQARRNADAKGAGARFEGADAMTLPAEPRYDTILDSALFHIFDDTDRRKYVASLHRACLPGGVVHVL